MKNFLILGLLLFTFFSCTKKNPEPRHIDLSEATGMVRNGFAVPVDIRDAEINLEISEAFQGSILRPEYPKNFDPVLYFKEKSNQGKKDLILIHQKEQEDMKYWMDAIQKSDVKIYLLEG